jgi:ABC-type phosphate/phosphonate transport system substrate-binding protein
VLGPSIAVEVSTTSSPTHEVSKLRRVPVSVRLIVTTDPHALGESGGIPIVAHTKLDGKVIERLRQTFFCYEKECNFWTRNEDERARHREWHKQREMDQLLKHP